MPASAVSPENNSRLKALRERHEQLSRQIEEAQRSLSTKDFFLNELKKQKLLVKEKLERFQSNLRETRA